MKQYPPGHTGNRDGMKSPHFWRWIWMFSVCVHACVLSHFSRVWLFATPWSIAHQAPLSMGILQVRILEWVAMPSSRRSSRPRDQTCVSYVSCIGKHVLYHYTTWEAHIRQYKMIWCSYQSLYISCSFPLVQWSIIILDKYSKVMRRRQWYPTPVLLPGKSHGRRSLVGYSPWGHKESDTTERLHFHFSLSCIGEGNGNPLQYSCLENPRDRGA